MLTVTASDFKSWIRTNRELAVTMGRERFEDFLRLALEHVPNHAAQHFRHSCVYTGRSEEVHLDIGGDDGVDEADGEDFDAVDEDDVDVGENVL
jgi:hypothetical protein